VTNALNLLGWNLLIVIPIAIAVWAMCRVPGLRRRPALCHVAWLLVLLKFLTPPFIPVPMLRATATEKEREVAVSPSRFRDEALPADRLVLHTEKAPLAPIPPTEIANSDSASQIHRRDSLAAPHAARETLHLSSRMVLLCLLGLSLSVSIGLWFSALSQFRRVRRLLKGNATQSGRAAELLNDVAKCFRQRSAPRLCIVDSSIAPMLWSEPGNSAIILPRQLADSLAERQLQMILAHELAHHLRRDHWTNLLAFHVTTLFWWHPVAWFARRELSAAAEASCDAWVLERLGAARKSYAQTLLAAVDFVTRQKLPRPAFGLSYGESHSLRRRVELLATPNVTSNVSRTGVILLALGASILIFYPAQAQEYSEPPQKSLSLSPSRVAHGESKPSSDSSRIRRTPQGQIDLDSYQTEGRTGGLMHGVGVNSSSGLEGTVVLLSNAADVGRDNKYYVTGLVFDKETKKPIAGAKIQILVDAEPNPSKRLLHGISQADGRYRIEVPMGSCRFWFPRLKPGFWLNDADAHVGFVTSPEKRVATHDIAARRGAAWPMQLSVEGGPVDLTGLFVSVMEVKNDKTRESLLRGEPVSFYDPLNESYSELGANGAGWLTQSGETGKLVVNVADGKRRFEGFRAEFLVDPRFDMTKIKSVTPIAGTNKVRMIDEGGAQTTISKATVTLHGGLPLLTFRIARTTPLPVQEFSGRIVDVTGHPVPDVRIGSALGSSGGSGATESVTQSGKDGRFAIKIPIYQSNERLHLVLILNKDGYAAADSRKIDLPRKPAATVDVGSLTLQAGYSLPVRVVDADGHPLPGATVEPGYDYAERRQIIRTDSQGRGLLRNLPSGLVHVTVSYGQHGKSERLVVSDVAADNEETTISLKSAVASPKPTALKPVPIAIGKAAPEWSVTGWSDHHDRKLSEYRGKVIVLEFWGTWCGPCVQSIPMMQALATKYEPQDVAFLNIHTPQEAMDQINKLKKLKAWQAPTAVDRGASLSEGETAQRYGVNGFPTIILIGRDGKVSFNSSVQPKDAEAFLTKMKAFAKSHSLPFPSEKGDNEVEAEKQLTALLRAYLSTEIDKLLARPAP
jgi:beta-lactamase regulating signal transducer with metallopeptidase domain/thiol-disulfide isomerase/thioredoxin